MKHLSGKYNFFHTLVGGSKPERHHILMSFLRRLFLFSFLLNLSLYSFPAGGIF
jgi:hypothetical protein